METTTPFIKRGRNVWDEINMPVSEFRERLAKIRNEMRKKDIDVFLLYGKGHDNYGNACYLSNYITEMPGGVIVVVPRQGEPALILEGFARGLPFARSITWINEVRACGDVGQECLIYLKEKELIPNTIGCAGLEQLMPYQQWQAFSESIGQHKLIDASHIISRLRMIKSFREVDQIRRSSRIISRVLGTLKQVDSRDITERLLLATAERCAYAEGAEDFRMLLARPEKANWSLHPAEDTPMPPGDCVIVYVAAAFERYWAEAVRTFQVESDHLVEHQATDIKAQYGKIAAMVKPGLKISELYREIIDNLKRVNIDLITDYGLAQGIGLSLQEPPIINPVDTAELEEGMCLTLRIAVKDRPHDFMIGNTIAITETDAEILTLDK